MWHSLDFVAQERNLPKSDFIGFAIANQHKYGLVNEFGYYECNTWHVDALVEDFKKEQAK